jgi:hypothetical protein
MEHGALFELLENRSDSEALLREFVPEKDSGGFCVTMFNEPYAA